MKISYLATGIMAGLAAAAIGAAPMAAAAPSTSGDRTTITDRPGHNAIVVHPPNVSAPNSYGSFSSPLPLLFFR